MNEDKELLTLAAKAAGIEGYWFENEYWNGIVGSHINGADTPWNPLLDDADALRLAVKLKMTIDVRLWDDEVQVRAYHEPSMYHISEKGDPCDATRRTIVRAAAEIGRRME